MSRRRTLRALRRLASLALGAVFLILLFWVWPRDFRRLNEAWAWPRWEGPMVEATGVALLAAGLAAVVGCALVLVRAGGGTPVPTDPPERLVAAGPFARSRNPIYLAYLLILLGEALLWGDAALLLYAALVAAATHLWVVLVEEPGLRRRFGEEFERYAGRVPRWL